MILYLNLSLFLKIKYLNNIFYKNKIYMENFTESGTCINDNLNEYKGIFYNENEEEEQKFYEGGAHFKYDDLYEILEEIVKKEEKHKNKIITEYNQNLENTIFNFIPKGKSRNNRDNINNKKEERKENGTEINKNKDNCINGGKNKLKKIFGISTFTLFDKKLKLLLKMNLPKKKLKKKKNSPIKPIKNIRPTSSTIQNKQINKRKEILILGNNFQNTSYPKGRNVINNKNKLNSLKKLSFSSQNLRKIFSPLNRFNIILSKNQKNKSLNKGNNNKQQIKNIIPTKTQISKINTVISNKSRNINIINEYNNFLQNLNEEKISRTFHNNNNNNNINKEEISYYQIKEKPHSLGKINSDSDNTININSSLKKNNDKIPSNLVSKTNQKLFNHKNRHIHLINNLFRNNKDIINNTNLLEISIKSNISSTHNLNIQIPSRNKKYKTTNVNKTSNNFIINSNINIINHLKNQKNNSAQKNNVNKGLINNKNKVSEKISDSLSKLKTKCSSVNSTGNKTNSIIGKKLL